MSTENPSFAITFKEKIFPKIETLFWVITALYQIYKYRLYDLHNHPDLHQACFKFAVFCAVFDILLFLSLYIYKDFLTPKDSELRNIEIDQAYPKAIYLATGTFVAGAVAFNKSIWGIFHWKTPVVSFCQFMLFIIIVAKFPGGQKKKNCVVRKKEE